MIGTCLVRVKLQCYYPKPFTYDLYANINVDRCVCANMYVCVPTGQSDNNLDLLPCIDKKPCPFECLATLSLLGPVTRTASYRVISALKSSGQANEGSNNRWYLSVATREFPLASCPVRRMTGT